MPNPVFKAVADNHMGVPSVSYVNQVAKRNELYVIQSGQARHVFAISNSTTTYQPNS